MKDCDRRASFYLVCTRPKFNPADPVSEIKKGVTSIIPNRLPALEVGMG